MDSRRFNGRAVVPRNAGKNSIPAAIRARYRLPGIRAAKGAGTVIRRGIIRSESSFGLLYAAMPAKRFHRYGRYISNLHISHSIAFLWPSSQYSSIRGYPSIQNHSSIGDHSSIRVHSSIRCHSSIGDHLSIRNHSSIRSRSPLEENMSIRPSKIHGLLPISSPSSDPFRDEFAPGSRLLPSTGSLSKPEWQRGNASGSKQTDIRPYRLPSIPRSPAEPVAENGTEFMPTAISRAGILPFRGGEYLDSEGHDEIRELAGRRIQFDKEHPPMRPEAEKARGYWPDGEAVHWPGDEPLIPEIERTSSGHPGRIAQEDWRLRPGLASSPFPLLSPPSRAIARISPENMISLKDMQRLIIGSESSLEPGLAILPSSNDLQSVISDQKAAASPLKLEFSRPAYRMASIKDPEPEEERISITSSHHISPASGSAPFAPSAQELNRISEQVCSIIERKLQIERERRGIYG